MTPSLFSTRILLAFVQLRTVLHSLLTCTPHLPAAVSSSLPKSYYTPPGFCSIPSSYITRLSTSTAHLLYYVTRATTYTVSHLHISHLCGSSPHSLKHCIFYLTQGFAFLRTLFCFKDRRVSKVNNIISRRICSILIASQGHKVI